MRSIKKLCVVGNGAVVVGSDGRHCINEHTARFLEQLQSGGMDVTFCDLHMESDQNCLLADCDLIAKGIRVRTVRTEGIAQRGLEIVRLTAFLRKQDFVYIFFPGSLARLVGNICVTARIPYGLYVRGEVFDNRRLDRRVLKNAAFALTVSPKLKKQLHEFIVDVATIKPMCHLEASHFCERGSTSSRPGKWKLLFVGRLEERKGVLDPVRAVEVVKQRGIDVELTLAGGGLLHDELRERVGSNGSFIKLLGQIDDFEALRKAYLLADMFVFPSHDEGFPRVLLQAMAHSLPVLTTMVGGIPGIMVDKFNCLEIPVRNPEEMAKTIERALSDTDALTRLAANGLSTARNILQNVEHHVLLMDRLR